MNKSLVAVILSVFSVFAVSCGEQEIHKTGIVAHRGFWKCEEAGYAQNSIAALRLAQKNGFWGSEFDVQLTLDEVPIVNHNEDLNGLVISETLLDTLKAQTLPNGEHPSTLDEYLAQGAECATTMLVFELKPQHDTVRDDILWSKSVESLKKYGLYDPSRVLFITFDPYLCDKIAVEAPEFANQYLAKNRTPDELASAGVNGIDFNYKRFRADSTIYPSARAHGMSVNVWTVDTDSTMVEFFDMGVDYLTTNEPMLARGILAERELKLTSPALK